MTDIKTLAAWAAGHQPAAAVLAGIAAVVVVAAWRAARRLLAGHQPADVFTVIAASVATSVTANGMWRFAGRVLHFSGPERVTMFAFLELAMLAEAFRARRNITQAAAANTAAADPGPVTAGVDGAAVWVFSGLSGLLSALDTSSAAAAIARLTTPLAAAWLWERSLSLYRRQLTGHSIHWTITSERILVRLGLAEPAGRTTSEVAAQRRLALLARAAKHTRTLRSAGAAGWRQRRAARRLDAAMTRAVEYAGLAASTARQDALLAQMGALYGAAALAELTPPAPWERPLPATTHTEPPPDEEPARTQPPPDEEPDRTQPPPDEEPDRTELPLDGDPDRTELPLDEGPLLDVPVDRDGVVAEMAAEILAVAAAGETWRPDYPALMTRTGFKRSWCEKAVRDARRAALGADDAAPCTGARTDAARTAPDARPGVRP